jgi:HTH-type transcriptional repressor of NAD biosynthesis genes
MRLSEHDHIDIVFCGSDYKGLNVFERLYKDSNIHYFDRRKINISSTQIRRNPYIYFEYLPKIVQQYFLKKIVIIGTESCGKSTLVRNLAKIYNTVYVQEVGRIICDEAGGIDNMKAEDFIKIFIKHKALEMEQEKYANKVLFIDTEAIVTLYYLGLQCGDMDLSMINNLGNSIANLNNYDLYIFLEPDVKWIQDGTRTYGEDETRQKNNLLLKQMLQERGITYEVINGGYHERFEKTKKLINMLISNL